MSISLRARASGRYLGARAGMLVTRAAAGARERFDLLDAGDGRVALRCRATGLLVSVAARGRLAVGAVRVGPSETFALVPNPDGTLSLRALATGGYLRVDPAGTGAPRADGTVIGTHECFDLIIN